MFEMICTLKIDANILNEIRGYKYVVYSPKMVQEDDCYEYLHSFVSDWSYQNPNRCLKSNLPDSDLKSMYVYTLLKRDFKISKLLQGVNYINMIAMFIQSPKKSPKDFGREHGKE